jgi:hypothetical protein
MSEIDEKEIKRRFQAISQFESSPEVTARDLERVRKRLIEQTSEQRTREQKMWRTIIKSRITKLAAAAAAIIIAVLIGISSLNGTSAWAKVIKAIKETIYTVEDRVAMEKINRPDLKDKTSGPERIRAHHKTLQIPDEELARLSSEELLDKITHTSLFIMAIMNPEPDDGLARFARSYNGVNAFLERPDAGKVLLAQYEKLTNEVSQGVQEKDGAFVFRFTIMETLMSSDRVINQMNAPEQPGCVAIAALS